MFSYKIFDSLLEPVFAIDVDGKIIYCNDPAAAICELSVRKLSRGMLLTEALSFEEVPLFLKERSELAAVSDPTPYQEMSFTSKQTDKPGKAQITCQKVEGEESWLIFFRDVTLEETLQKKYRAELEQVQHYSKNLERLVDERTSQIRELNKTMTALLNSLHQGFFIFNTQGLCLDVTSKACEQTVETNPAGQSIWDVLKLPEYDQADFKKWMDMLFAEVMAFEDLVPLGPQSFAHSAQKSIRLEYYPIRGAQEKIEAIVVVATDITNLVEAQKAAEVERAHAKMVLNLLRNKRQVGGFLRDAEELLQKINIEIKKGQTANFTDLFRSLHTLKGGSALYSVKAVVDLCHHAEESLVVLQREGFSPENFKKLAELCVATQIEFNKFKEENIHLLGSALTTKDRRIEAPMSRYIHFYSQILQISSKLAGEFIHDFLTEPVGTFFEQYNGLIENQAANEGKEVLPIQFVHGDLQVFPEAYEELFASCVHAFRNAVDHGIEFPDERESIGKARQGLIEVSFRKITLFKKSHLVIRIKDNGRGINPDIIREKLTKKGLDVSKESDRQVIQHIFDPQFSTREAVTETSGRGVGMDAIQYCAHQIGGRTSVRSVVGHGSTLKIIVPWIVPNYSISNKKLAS